MSVESIGTLAKIMPYYFSVQQHDFGQSIDMVGSWMSIVPRLLYKDNYVFGVVFLIDM